MGTEHAIDRETLRERYDAILATVTPPFAFVDLDALRRNGQRMLEQAGGLPIRVASKSVRSVAVLRRILELDPGFRGVLAFTVPEALHLAANGFDDLVVAYPSVDRRAIGAVAVLAAESPARAPVLMVDDRPHLDLIEGAIGGGPARVRVCLDIDAGWWPLGGRLARIGPKRSPVHDPERARRMAAETEARPGTRLAGLMAYEGQIAGVGDRIPGRPLRSLAIRAMQAASLHEIRDRLPRIIAAVREALRASGGELDFVNGGGTGSLARTAAGEAVTELAAGSGFYTPALFDNYRSLDLEPAAFFCLSV
ncbi:MAG: alanine racemase, partial [Thermoleophilaceae bacterium]